MTPDEHYRAAEAILRELDDYDLSNDPALMLALAQAHATLAATRPPEPATIAESPTDAELVEAFGAWKVARMGEDAQASRAGYQSLLGVIARIDDDLRREHWIGKVKNVSLIDVRQIRRAVNEQR